MADESQQTFRLNLDIKEFTEKALDAKGQIQNIGSAENLVGLVEGLVKVSGYLAAVGVVAFALKGTFEAVFEAERIQKVNNLFETLTKQIGLSASAMRDDLLKATKGLADDTDVLKAANRAIISMGDSSKDLAKIMDIARKLTVAFGGDLIERFEQLTYAISSGSTRMLKANGIVVDTEKAIRAYAKSLGVSADSLTEAGRRQAVLNEVIAFGDTRLKNIKGSVDSAITTWQQLKVTIQNLSETLVLAFERLAGPSVRSALKWISDIAKEAGFALTAKLGTGAEQAEAKLHELEKRAAAFRNAITQLQEDKGIWSWIAPSLIHKGADALEKLKQGLKDTEAEIASMRKAQEEAKKAEAATVEKPKKEAAFDVEKEAANRLRFESEILRIKEEAARRSVELAKNEEELKKAQSERALVLEEEFQMRKKEIETQYAMGKIVDAGRMNEMLLELKRSHELQMQSIEQQSIAERERMEENYLRNSQGTFDGIARAAQVSANQANRALANFGQTGMMVMNTLKNRGADAFVAFGRAAIDHSQSAAEIMKGFFLNSLADIAEAQGKLYLAAGLVDPTKLAAGAALLALSGVLRAMAGSAGGGGGIGAVETGGGGAASFGGGAVTAPSPEAQTSPTKSVNVNIMGHYLETEATKTWLMDQIRQATDATDFAYKQIGQA